MIGLGELLLSYLRRQIGLRTDSDSASGSVHSKLGDIRSTLISSRDSIMSAVNASPDAKYEPFYFAGYAQDIQATATTVFEVYGSGYLCECVVPYDFMTNKTVLRVTIDSVVTEFWEWHTNGGWPLGFVWAASRDYNDTSDNIEVMHGKLDYDFGVGVNTTPTYGTVMQGYVFVLFQPLYFNSYLKITLHHDDSGSVQTCPISYTGAIRL